MLLKYQQRADSPTASPLVDVDDATILSDGDVVCFADAGAIPEQVADICRELPQYQSEYIAQWKFDSDSSLNLCSVHVE